MSDIRSDDYLVNVKAVYVLDMLGISDPSYFGIHSIDELPAHIFDEILHFFTVYKQLENKQTDVKSLFGPQEAQRIVAEAIEGYRKTFKK